MIVKNEANCLPRCLESAANHVDEIVVVDTGSEDDTVAIAERFTERVLHYTWHDHFADARNEALRHATGDWLVVLDADEVIEPAGWETIRAAIAETTMDGFYLTQRNYGAQRTAQDWVPVREKTAYSGDYPGYRANPILRLFRNREDIHYIGRVHEVVDRTLQPKKRERLDVAIHHYMDEDPTKPVARRQREYLRLIEQGTKEGMDGRLHTAAGSIRLHYLEDFPGAIEHLQEAVALGYEVQANSESIAEARYRMGDTEGAYRDYLALHEAGYRSFNLCNNLANLAVHKGRRPFAADLLEQALGLGVADEQARSRLQHNIRYLRANPEG